LCQLRVQKLSGSFFKALYGLRNQPDNPCKKVIDNKKNCKNREIHPIHNMGLMPVPGETLDIVGDICKGPFPDFTGIMI
jgi:hypothetical protein